MEPILPKIYLKKVKMLIFSTKKVEIINMFIQKEFSKHAFEYDNFNIIQQLAAKALVRDIINKPKKILEIGSGSGQVIKYVNWDFDLYTAVDFSDSMCEIHPKRKNLNIICSDFDSDQFIQKIRNKYFDIIISSSSLQWSKNLPKLLEHLSKMTKTFYAVLFTSNTFKSIQNITQIPSPILCQEDIKNAFLDNFKCDFEIFNYKLEFKNKKDLFSYIKKSGVASNTKALNFKNAKKLYKEYKLNYLEFELIFVKAISKS